VPLPDEAVWLPLISDESCPLDDCEFDPVSLPDASWLSDESLPDPLLFEPLPESCELES
jgi:hypothetical protein